MDNLSERIDRLYLVQWCVLRSSNEESRIALAFLFKQQSDDQIAGVYVDVNFKSSLAFF